MSEFAALDRRLQELHERTAETPLFNPSSSLAWNCRARWKAAS
jgi:hypothetical protein